MTCGYGERAVLRDISLQIRAGEIVALLGGSGCGKSTLLRTMVGLAPPMAGQVFLLGEDLYALDKDARFELLKRVGMLFQQGALFGSLTAGENLAWPLREHTDLPDELILEMVRMKLGAVGLAGLADRVPADLSGGQRKRVALARSIALDPAVLFCDEPSAGLDPVTAASLDQTLIELRDTAGLTIVAVTHELESIKALSDRAIMLGDGRILATGTVAELEQSPVEEVRRFFAREPAPPAGGTPEVMKLWDIEPQTGQ